jgi:hypothetical protein
MSSSKAKTKKSKKVNLPIQKHTDKFGYIGRDDLNKLTIEEKRNISGIEKNGTNYIISITSSKGNMHIKSKDEAKASNNTLSSDLSKTLVNSDR